MIDFTDDEHKRGVMILSSKDVRTVDRYLFDYRCNLMYVDTMLGVIKSSISRMEIDEEVKDATIIDIDYMLEVITKAKFNAEKVKDVFR